VIAVLTGLQGAYSKFCCLCSSHERNLRKLSGFAVRKLSGFAGREKNARNNTGGIYVLT
jgi:hypothetical protein